MRFLRRIWAATLLVGTVPCQAEPKRPPAVANQWAQFAQTADRVVCTPVLSELNAQARGYWAPYTLTFTAYRWAAQGWVNVLTVGPATSDYQAAGFEPGTSVETSTGDVPYTRGYPMVTLPVPALGDGPFMDWRVSFESDAMTPTVTMTLHSKDALNGFKSVAPLVCARPKR